jgi:hypothetical protein
MDGSGVLASLILESINSLHFTQTNKIKFIHPNQHNQWNGKKEARKWFKTNSSEFFVCLLEGNYVENECSPPHLILFLNIEHKMLNGLA